MFENILEVSFVRACMCFSFVENLQEPFLRSIQNDDWKAMPGSFLPPAPADKAGT